MKNGNCKIKKIRMLAITMALIIPCFAIAIEGNLTPSYAIECGAVIGPYEDVTLDHDLNCKNVTALTVVGPATLNMKGHTLYGESAGAGILVYGDNAKVMNGAVEGFRDAVVVLGNGNHHISKITAAKNVANGFIVGSSNNKFVGNTADGNGSEGFILYGKKNKLVNNISVNNGGVGFVLLGIRNKLVNNKTDNNPGGGIIDAGDGNTLKNNKLETTNKKHARKK